MDKGGEKSPLSSFAFFVDKFMKISRMRAKEKPETLAIDLRRVGLLQVVESFKQTCAVQFLKLLLGCVDQETKGTSDYVVLIYVERYRDEFKVEFHQLFE